MCLLTVVFQASRTDDFSAFRGFRLILTCFCSSCIDTALDDVQWLGFRSQAHAISCWDLISDDAGYGEFTLPAECERQLASARRWKAGKTIIKFISAHSTRLSPIQGTGVCQVQNFLAEVHCTRANNPTKTHTHSIQTSIFPFSWLVLLVVCLLVAGLTFLLAQTRSEWVDSAHRITLFLVCHFCRRRPISSLFSIPPHTTQTLLFPFITQFHGELSEPPSSCRLLQPHIASTQNIVSIRVIEHRCTSKTPQPITVHPHCCLGYV